MFVQWRLLMKKKWWWLVPLEEIDDWLMRQRRLKNIPKVWSFVMRRKQALPWEVLWSSQRKALLVVLVAPLLSADDETVKPARWCLIAHMLQIWMERSISLLKLSATQEIWFIMQDVRSVESLMLERQPNAWTIELAAIEESTMNVCLKKLMNMMMTTC